MPTGTLPWTSSPTPLRSVLTGHSQGEDPGAYERRKQGGNEGIRKASSLGVMGTEGVMALQVNGWKPLVAGVTDSEQREFVRQLVAAGGDDERRILLREADGRLVASASTSTEALVDYPDDLADGSLRHKAATQAGPEHPPTVPQEEPGGVE